MTPTSGAKAAAPATYAVVGGGIAGLTAAWELACAGAQVELYEASERLGGALAPLQLGGVRVDAGAEAFATRTPAVREFLDELGLADRIVSPNPAGAWLQLPGLAAPLPATGILGIPGDPTAGEVARLLGTADAARAAEDLTAAMTWTAQQSPSLGEVVVDRMGPAVVEKLVAPITSGVHSADPHQLPMSTAHPRLYQAMLEHGSLARAVAALRAAAPAGSSVQSLRGGMNTLISALEEQLRQLGVRIRLNTPVATGPPPWLLQDLQGREYSAVILAAGAQQAAQLLGSPGDGPAGVALVTLLVHAPELDAHPRGTGMLVAPSVAGIGAKAMTHISAKWAWAAQSLEAQLGPGHHLVRLSYGRTGDHGAALGFHSTEEALYRAALADLPQLTGTAVTPEQVLDHTVVRWRRGGISPQAQGLQERLKAQAERGGPEIAAVGESFAGTGLAQVIPHARQAARHLLGQGRAA
ncbi:protoporphyrinogen oxidase [Nesterenkonia alkaliphila]|uniref:Coproporphyrinogen III oxidase n=1 Tax=Nesterenkonia alkaliphila TaxID=1463631 RepID=A0A7K1UGS6_9MICC|nr:protoporphyrinogen oxidase [Nesterenkonia alkaliphila]MVT25673.1 protoporphyrinogen oxidase [Nesterenkonia alkaliphila]GFZ85019.1 protoporphyrinogen oxidase HemY' [Nesterenkonia alkaliphila]